jgi:hypothetical protein
MDPGAAGVQQIDDPVPPIGGLDHHLRIRARLCHRRRDRQRIVGHADARELLARRAHPDNHRPPTMKVDILSIRASSSSSEGWL